MVEWWNGVRLVAVKSGAELSRIHPGIDNIRELLRKYWPQLMKPVTKPVQIGLRPLVKLGNLAWFTQYPKQGAGMDTYEPEFWVTSIEPVGDKVSFGTPTLGYYGFFKYDITGVAKLAPKGANAYSLVSDPTNILVNGNPDFQQVEIQFYHVEIDNTKRLIREGELINDYETLMKLISQDNAAS
jgi:hypothetical protein